MVSGSDPDPDNSREMYERRRLPDIAARWDARAGDWDRALGIPDCCLNEDDAYRRFNREVQRLIARRRQFCAAHGVIDAGCGTGLVLAGVVSAFAWGMGLDISPQMIEAARAKGLANTTFQVGDCFQLPALCPRAGAVLSRGVLLSHYGREQGQKLLNAARAALVPGGFLVCDFLNEAARARQRHAPENKIWFHGKEILAMARLAQFGTVTILGGPRRRARLLLAET